MYFLKKCRVNYGIYALILILLGSLLSGCRNQKATQTEQEESMIQSSIPAEDEMDSQSEKEESEESEEASSQSEETERELVVENGDYLIEILQKLVDLGWGDSVEQLLNRLDEMDRSQFRVWSQISNAKERAFIAEGYIAPGTYYWPESASLEEVLGQLLGSWDLLLDETMEAEANRQGYTIDEILIMASIVEWESSVDPYQIVKPDVAAVVRNRVESETALQMDVTIFYLQDALAPYRDAEQFEASYDTYLRSTLPAGPIGSPSLESVQAVLTPADTKNLFFVYDEEGNYYFAEDYDQHLLNCQLAGIE